MSQELDFYDPTGEIEDAAGGPELVIEREFHQGPSVIWGYLTDTKDLGRWHGEWSKEADSPEGHPCYLVDHVGQTKDVHIEVTEKVKPEYLRFEVSFANRPDAWMDLRLTDTPEGSELELRHGLAGLEDRAEFIGPLWEFLLDRLMAAVSGDDPDILEWESYYPNQAEYYTLESNQ